MAHLALGPGYRGAERDLACDRCELAPRFPRTCRRLELGSVAGRSRIEAASARSATAENRRNSDLGGSGLPRHQKMADPGLRTGSRCPRGKLGDDRHVSATWWSRIARRDHARRFAPALPQYLVARPLDLAGVGRPAHYRDAGAVGGAIGFAG